MAQERLRLAACSSLAGTITLDGHHAIPANYFLDALTSDHRKQNLTSENR